jgi:uncharacterized protein
LVTLVLSNLKAHFPQINFSFYRTQNGAEVDFVLEYGIKSVVIECKASKAPSLSKGNYNAIDDIHPIKTFVVAPVSKGWPMKKGIDVVSLNEVISQIGQIIQ